MRMPFLNQIDWTRPWLAHVREVGEAIAHAPDWRHELNHRASAKPILNHRQLPIHFVPQSELQPNIAYETFISNTGCVPTRDNLHDFFNALVWLTFPQIKVQLNALQALEIERVATEAGATPRGKLRDAATIFDENAALVITLDHDLVHALRAHKWQDVFVRRRSNFMQSWNVLLFGHALMEKLVSPYKAITGHAWVVALDVSFERMSLSEQCELIDVLVAGQLTGGLSTADFSPLPVLGVPQWWPDQGDSFYQDASIFRDKRQK